MIQSNSTLDILVGGQRVDILDRSSINLRMNNVVYDPTEINNTQAEYSFSFNLPTTPNNNKIFDYANELAKVNKFKNTYDSEVYVDGVLVFSGSLRIQSIKKGFYNVNLVNVKINTVDDIFEDMTLNQIKWNIPFIGPSSINTYNADPQSKVIFPLVSYGVFQKQPSSTQFDYDNYTSKFWLDKYTKWYYESFNPSPNLLEFIKKCFEQKGYELRGNIFQDPVIPNLYMSINLEDDQIPQYNLGNPNLGQATISCSFTNYLNKKTGQPREANYLTQSLSFPYLPVGDQYNWTTINIYDLWTEENSAVAAQDQHFLFNEGDKCIVIPASGLYKIQMNVNIRIPTQSLQGVEYGISPQNEVVQLTGTLENSLQTDMPVEVQLIRNTDNCELIHGPQQWSWVNRTGNKQQWLTAYPHENLYQSKNPTSTDPRWVSGANRSGNRTVRVQPGWSTGTRADGNSIIYNSYFGGYTPMPGEFLAYDPAVSENFVMGYSSMSNGTFSVIKNGYGWQGGEKNDSRYNCDGYYGIKLAHRGQTSTEYEKTDYNRNKLKDTVSSRLVEQQRISSLNQCIVQLEKDDILILKAITRNWGNTIYQFDCDVDLQIEAYSPQPIESIETQDRGWRSPSQFDIDLSIGQFMNNKTKIADFVNNFIKEFNLEFINEGKIVYLNKQQFDVTGSKYALDLDSRVNSADGEARLIDYPSSMEVKYKIDTEEWGFETTVPPDHINDEDWEEWGDYGYDKVVISDRDDSTEESVQLTTSYCYYDTFKILNDSDQIIGEITIPVISKYSYMIDGYSYEDSMRYDGKGLPMRYWFRGKKTPYNVLVNGKYQVALYDTTNEKDGYTLSYHQKEGSLLNTYFNISPDLSGNYLTIKCYLTSEEYRQLKGGCNVLFDSDIYIVSEIQGYDAMGLNETTLLLIKK